MYTTIHNPLCTAGCGRLGGTRLQEIEEEEGVGVETAGVTRFPPCFPDGAYHHASQKLWIIGYSWHSPLQATREVLIVGQASNNERTRQEIRGHFINGWPPRESLWNVIDKFDDTRRTGSASAVVFNWLSKWLVVGRHGGWVERTRSTPSSLTVLDVTPVSGVRGDIGADKMYRLLILKHTGVYDELDGYRRLASRRDCRDFAVPRKCSSLITSQNNVSYPVFQR